MTLHTARLILAPVHWSDAADIHALNSLPESDRYNTLGIPDNLAVTESLVQEWLDMQTRQPLEYYVWSIKLADTGAFVGNIALRLGKQRYRMGEVWYKIHVNHWDKGYATEALETVLQMAFEQLRLHRVEAGCAVENRASSAVLQKVGMVREGGKRKALPIRGEWVDNDEFAILEDEYFERKMNK